MLEGIISELGGLNDLDLVIEYMDTKRISTDAYYHALNEIYTMKYAKTRFNVILATDDNAYQFSLARQEELFKQTPIVFCGVNRFDPQDVENHPKVTGVVEKGDFQDTLMFAGRVRSKAAAVYVILDDTSTGKINRDAFLQTIKQELPDLRVDFLINMSLPELKRRLAALPADDFAFFISFWVDSTGQSISPDSLSKAFYKSAVPIFGRSEWMINKGLTGGKCVSGFHQGEAAARLVKRILAGENAADIPVNKDSPNRFMFDYRLLDRYRIDLSLLPEGSIIFNKPAPTFYRMYYKLIWLTASIVFVLTVLVLSLTMNIILRRKTETALRESEEKYRRIFENSVVGFYQSTPEGRFITANPALARMLRYDYSDDLINCISDIGAQLYVNKNDWALHQDIINKQGKVDGFETKARKKDGSEIWVSNTTRAYFDGDGKVLYYDGVVSDITDKKEAEKAIRERNEIKARFKKMESLGLMAGGVAHDLNNILSGIVGYPDLILMDLPEDSGLRPSILAIKESGERAVAVVQELLTFARGVATAVEPLNLNGLIRDYLESPDMKTFYRDMDIQFIYSENLLNILGSKIHIRKILMNLVSNAIEAVGSNGQIIISTENRYIDKPFRGYDAFKEGEYVILSVKDNGSGISEDDRERVFEPFYTRKVLGRSGTGLGLAVVWNIVKDHNGFIDLVSNENGTIFSIYFPATREKGVDAAVDDRKKFEDYKGKGETILIVDDIDSQRALTFSMMEKLNYHPVCVSSGEAAVEYVKQHDVDLVILDMIMDPGINGRETYERILKIKPGQKAIITSGFVQTDEVVKARKLGAGRYIKKPFSLETIGVTVRTELEDNG